MSNDNNYGPRDPANQHPGEVLHDAARQPRPLRSNGIHVISHPISGGAFPSEAGRGGIHGQATPVVHPSAEQNLKK